VDAIYLWMICSGLWINWTPKKDYTIVCYYGTQSLVAARLLQAKGFTCHYLEGGLEAYLAL